MEWHILIYLSYKKSSNIRKNLQHYSQDVNYYETLKKMYKKAIKIFLPVDNMCIASLRQSNESSRLNCKVLLFVYCHAMYMYCFLKYGFLSKTGKCVKCRMHHSFSCKLFVQKCTYTYVYFQDLGALVEEEKKRMLKEAEEINKKTWRYF